MSSDSWRKHVERFRKYDPWVTTIVILALIALILHEGTAIVTGRVPFATSSGDGPYGRVLLGVIVAASAFWTRQTRKDVLTDVTVTTEVRDRVTSIQDNAAPPPSHERDVLMVLTALEAKSAASEKALEAKHQMERHKQESLLKVTQQEARDYLDQVTDLKIQVRDLTDKLMRCAESKGTGDKPC